MYWVGLLSHGPPEGPTSWAYLLCFTKFGFSGPVLNKGQLLGGLSKPGQQRLKKNQLILLTLSQTFLSLRTANQSNRKWVLSWVTHWEWAALSIHKLELYRSRKNKEKAMSIWFVSTFQLRYSSNNKKWRHRPHVPMRGKRYICLYTYPPLILGVWSPTPLLMT